MCTATAFLAALAVSGCGGGGDMTAEGAAASSGTSLQVAQVRLSTEQASQTPAAAPASAPIPASGPTPSPVPAPAVATSAIIATGTATPIGFITVKDGHLSRSGVRVRQWGVNVQSGVFKTYTEIDFLVARLKGLGFNAIRLWPTSGTFYSVGPNGAVRTSATRGDGSALDRYDYLVYKAAAAGMTIQMTALHYIDAQALRANTNGAIKELIGSARSDAEHRLIHGIAPYLSSEYRELIKQHISHQLLRINPYTQRRYADEPAVSTWELANEARFVECAVTVACVSALPSPVFNALSSQWRVSSRNVAGSPLPNDMEAFLAGPAYPAYTRFVAAAFIDASTELRQHARTVGGSGSGVAVQPFVFNTGPIVTNALAHYAYGQGDAFSIGSYRSPLKDAGALDGSAWLPVAAGGNVPSYLSYVKLEGKPMIIYETSFFRPYRYRAEWGPVMAALALQQDWDAVFLYQYGHPGVAYSGNGGPESYGTVPLPEPGATSPEAWKRDYTYGFHHGGDPVTMGSWSVGARLFTSASETAPLQRTWRIALDSVFSRRAGNGYPPGYFEAASIAAKAGAVAISFVTDSAQACLPCAVGEAMPGSYRVSWPDAIHPNLTVQSPGGKSVTGTLSGSLGDMTSGFTAHVSRPGFGVAAVLNERESLLSPQKRTLQVVGEVTNTDMIFSRNLVDYASPVGAIYGLLKQGTTPLTHSGPSVEFRAVSPSTFATEDFGLRVQSTSMPALATQVDAATGSFRVRVDP